MKKLIAIAASALCGAVMANSIESSNIVGYQTIGNVAKGKYYPLAVQFETIDGNNIAVKDLVTVENPSGGLTIGVGADQIWRWDTSAANWVKYFWRSGRGVTTPCWCKENETIETTDTVPVGENVFFFRGGSTATTITLAGGVKSFAATTSYSVNKGNFVFMGYPWPINMNVANFSEFYTNGTMSGGLTIGVGADQIWRWDTASDNWVKYFYRSGRGVSTPGWCKENETTITEDIIPAGEGFFFFRGGAATVNIQFSK